MIPVTLAEVATATGGTLIGGADPAAVVDGPVEFDSRAVTPGSLFVALPGTRVDGHDFVAAAMAGGAVAALVSRPVDAPAVLVADALAALGLLARAVLDRLPDLVVVGVTGSSGKTSTKDLLAQLLARLGPTVAPPGSFNNELGHPYTVLRADATTRYLVLEKSARGLGHIRWLTQVAPPRIGVVLNVGAAHMGEFGSVEVTAQAKGELVEALPPDGLAVLNADDPRVRAMGARTAARTVLVGQAPDAEVRADGVALDAAGRPSFTLTTPAGAADVRLALHGAHHVGNALAAAAVALELGMPLPAVADALAEARPRSPRRMEVVERPDGVTVVDDTYNANPDSVRAALVALRAMAGTGANRRRSWAVLGHMAELGSREQVEHEEVGRFVGTLGVDRLVVVGPAAAAIHAGATRNGVNGGESVYVSNVQDAVELLSSRLRPGDVVLVKASKAAHLERVTAALLGRADGTDAAGGAA